MLQKKIVSDGARQYTSGSEFDAQDFFFSKEHVQDV